MSKMAARLLSKSFGDVVRAQRNKLGLTQEQIAERAGVHPTYVGMVERGERNCSLDISGEIAKALEVKLSQLIDEAEVLNRKHTGAGNRKGRRS
jgi:transcriptional regulator with XRE-family HTH domain